MGISGLLSFLVVANLSATSQLFGFAAATGPSVWHLQLQRGEMVNVRVALRTAATAEEIYFVDHEHYTESLDDLRAAEFTPTDGVQVIIASATKTGFCLVGSLSDGSSVAYYDSEHGGTTDIPCH